MFKKIIDTFIIAILSFNLFISLFNYLINFEKKQIKNNNDK